MKISCPRCLKNDLLETPDFGYVDLWNHWAKLYKCNSCSLIFFISVPSKSDNWRLFDGGEIIYFSEGEVRKKKSHECLSSSICTCYPLDVEPRESCPVHGVGEWPPRCCICGKFISWKKETIR